MDKREKGLGSLGSVDLYQIMIELAQRFNPGDLESLKAWGNQHYQHASALKNVSSVGAFCTELCIVLKPAEVVKSLTSLLNFIRRVDLLPLIMEGHLHRSEVIHFENTNTNVDNSESGAAQDLDCSRNSSTGQEMHRTCSDIQAHEGRSSKPTHSKQSVFQDWPCLTSAAPLSEQQDLHVTTPGGSLVDQKVQPQQILREQEMNSGACCSRSNEALVQYEGEGSLDSNDSSREVMASCVNDSLSCQPTENDGIFLPLNTTQQAVKEQDQVFIISHQDQTIQTSSEENLKLKDELLRKNIIIRAQESQINQQATGFEYQLRQRENQIRQYYDVIIAQLTEEIDRLRNRLQYELPEPDNQLSLCVEKLMEQDALIKKLKEEKKEQVSRRTAASCASHMQVVCPAQQETGRWEDEDTSLCNQLCQLLSELRHCSVPINAEQMENLEMLNSDFLEHSRHRGRGCCMKGLRRRLKACQEGFKRARVEKENRHKEDMDTEQRLEYICDDLRQENTIKDYQINRLLQQVGPMATDAELDASAALPVVPVPSSDSSSQSLEESSDVSTSEDKIWQN